MSGVRPTTVLGQLGLTQVQYVSPVRLGAAQGLTSRVYQQVEREFGMLAPPVALHSPAPDVLAASWVMMREILLVTGKVDRTAKEAVAAAVSLANTCPYCFAVHDATFSGLSGDSVRSTADPRLSAIAAWARDSANNEPPCSPEETPELIGAAVLLHYFNRMVNVFLTDVPLPPGAPKMMLGPVLRVLGRKILPAAALPHQPGASLDLLPAAPLPGDLSWAAGNAVVAGALARGSAAIGGAAARSVPPAVRDMLTAELDNWHGEPHGPSRAWVARPLDALPEAHRPAGRLALLTALASYQVDRSVIDEFRSGGGEHGDAGLVELTSWASLAAARRVGARMSATLR